MQPLRVLATAQEFPQVRKQWESLVDPVIRPDNEALHGMTVGKDENFIIGGSPAQFPGHWRLPSAQRMNCRCTLVSSLPGFSQRADKLRPGAVAHGASNC